MADEFYDTNKAGDVKKKIDAEYEKVVAAFDKMVAVVPEARAHSDALANVRSAVVELKATVDTRTR